MPKPLPNDYAPYFAKYISLVQSDDLKTAFEEEQQRLISFLNSVPDEKANYAYAKGKWTVKQLLQHVIDTERIFTYRALWIARKSEGTLFGFDENAYASIADVSNRTLQELKDELLAVRKSSQCLFNSFTQDDLERRGISNHVEVTPNAIGFITLGHVVHHKNVFEAKYL